jgi:alpha,alpha-trehalose phosphorylase
VPAEPWALTVARLDPRVTADALGQAETIFALANGHLGIRGTQDEGAPAEEPGTYLAGFYETRPIAYGESAYGFPKVGQSMLACPDGAVIRLVLDDEPFDLATAEVTAFRRSLDLRRGVLTRDVTWTTAGGLSARLRTTRMVSLARRHLAAIDWELVVDGAAEVVVSSEIVEPTPAPTNGGDPRLAEAAPERDLRPAGAAAEGLRAVLGYVTDGSRLALACGMDHAVLADCRHAVRTSVREGRATTVLRAGAEPGRPVRLHKLLAYHHGRADELGALRDRVGWTLDHGLEAGLPHLIAEQEARVARFWQGADVEVGAGDGAQQVVRWNLFQLMQASARVEGHGIGARGLTGRTYEGHCFWDTEIYVLPFLIYTDPRAARAVLKWRHDGLDRARARAAELGHPGATFPWRTINGDEASAYYAAGTAQYHINADVAFAVRKYVDVTEDVGFLHRYGAEILVETARLWRSLGFFSARHEGCFCINGVTGPDEYNAVVDNNYFTNLMAQENMAHAARVVEEMRRDHPAAFAGLAQRTALGDDEPASWVEAARRMYLPFDERLRIHPQDDGFLDKEVWDFAATPEEDYPLLLHHHPLNLYRRQVIKQADILLAMFLANGRFSGEQKKRNFDYYDPITTHDSSLSVCIQSIVANEIGYRDRALEYYEFAAAMDLSDVGGNVRHGAHVASIGGTWMALAYGFAGMRDHGGRIAFAPRLPEGWTGLRFALRVRGARIRVEIDHARTLYRLEEGGGLAFHHEGEPIELTRAAPEAVRPNAPAPSEPRAGPGAEDPALPDAAAGQGRAADPRGDAIPRGPAAGPPEAVSGRGGAAEVP